MKVGDVFISYDSDSASSRLEQMKAKLETDIETIKTKQTELADQMAKLKVELYGKFGTNINLETEEGE